MADFVLPFDPDDPPYAAPDDADPLVWRLARGLWLDHQAGYDGWCVTCRHWYPCRNRQLADRGLLLAVVPAVFHRLRPDQGNSGTEYGRMRLPINESGPHPAPGRGRTHFEG